MKKHTVSTITTGWATYRLLVFALLFIACNDSGTTIVENDPTVFAEPTTNALHLADPVPIEWDTIDPRDIQPPSIYPMNIDDLPSKSFQIDEFRPLKAPIKELALNWNQLPDSALIMDTIELEPEQNLLRIPVVTKIDAPLPMTGTTTALLQLSINNGLSNNNITDLLQNRDGSFWISSNPTGLSLYNGAFLYVYDFADVREISKDHLDRLWLATYTDGTYVLDFEQGTETHIDIDAHSVICDHSGQIWLTRWQQGLYTIAPDLSYMIQTLSHPFTTALTLMEDSQNRIWLGLRDRLIVVDKSRSQFRTILSSDQLPIRFVYGLFEDRHERVWVGFSTQKGAMSISIENDQVQLIGQEQGFEGRAVLYEEDRAGKLWIMDNGYTYVLSADQKRIKRISTSSTMVTGYRGSSMIDDRGTLWQGTMDRGIILIDPEGPLCEQIEDFNGQAVEPLWAITEDEAGNIWMGGDNGIHLFDPQKETIQHLDLKVFDANWSSAVQDLIQYPHSQMLFSSVSGFGILDLTKGVVKLYKDDQGIIGSVSEILPRGEDKLWLVGNRGLTSYDFVAKQAIILSVDSGQILGPQIDFIDDGLGRLWIASNQGLSIINIEDNSIQSLRQKEGLCNDHISDIDLIDGQIWIATLDGISIVDPVEMSITNLGKEQGLDPAEFYDLQSKGDKVYGGTINGLLEITSRQNSNWMVRKFARGEGFRANDYHQDASMVRSNDQLWLVASLPNTLTIWMQDPIADTSTICTHITGMTIRDQFSFVNLGKKLIPSLASDTTMTDADLVDDPQPNPAKRTYAEENGITWDSLLVPYGLPRGLLLPHDQNALQFSFSGQSVLNRATLSYRYKLEGNDDQWIYSGNEHQTKTYYNLVPGKYTFIVASNGGSQNWGEEAQLTFTILPPWWQTWWAFMIYVLLISGLIWGVVKYRSRNLLAANRLLEEKVADRTSELSQTIEHLKATQEQLIHSEKMASLGELTAGIAHEIQNPLNFVNNFAEVSAELLDEMNEEIANDDFEEVKSIAGNLKQNLEKITHHGKRADSIVKGMLQHSRQNNGDRIATNLNKLADEYLRLSYHGLRATNKSFNASFDLKLDETIPEIEVVPQDIGRAMLNLFTNAFHAVSEKASNVNGQTYQPSVLVGTKQIQDKIEIWVTDNGNGIAQEMIDKIFQPFFTTKPTGQGTGLGLSLSYDIVSAHGGQLLVESENGKGTTFKIILPINHTKPV